MEVCSFICERYGTEEPDKISFIGHSLGGLIITAALPFLELYSDKMHLMLAMGTPFLGVGEASSKLVSIGVWVMRTVKRSQCLDELALSDKPGLDGCLHRLSKNVSSRRWNMYCSASNE